MHNMYRITFIFITSSIVLSSVGAGPAQPLTLYESLIDYSSKCPYLKTTKLLKPNPSYLETCSAFAEIQNIARITRESAYDVSCLLFANNFMLLCNNTIEFEKIITNDTIDKALEVFNNLTIACNILQTTTFIPTVKNGKNITTLLKNPRICSAICSEITSEGITPICSLAAYSLSLVSTISKPDVNTIPKTGEIVKPHDDSNGVPKQAPPPVPPAKEQVMKPKQVEKSVPKNNGEKPHEDVNQSDAKKEMKAQTITEHEDDNTSDVMQSQSVSNTQTKIETPTDISSKKTESTPSESTQQTHSETHSTQQDDQKKGTALENKQTSKSQDEHPENAKVKEAPEVSKIQNADHVEESEKQKDATAQKIPAKSDAKDEEKKPSDPVPPANEIPNEEVAVLEPQNDDDPEINGETNSLDGNDDINLPPNEDDLLSKDGAENQNNKKAEKVKQTNTKPKETDEDVVGSIYNNPNTDEEDSFFFIYFMMVCAVFILGYIGYHNKQKVLALVIEGRRGRRGSRRGRPNSANYHKLDSNLEEAVTSSCNKNTTNIIY